MVRMAQAMVSLYLRAPAGVEVGDGHDARRRREWLDSIGALLQKFLTSEARMWLITTLSSLHVPSKVQVDCFFDLLHNSLRENARRGGETGHGKRVFFACNFFVHICQGCASLVVRVSSVFKVFRVSRV